MVDRRLSVVVAVVGLASAASLASGATNEITQPFEGVRLIHSVTTSPRMLDMWVAEIDPKAPGIKFLASPSNGSLPGETTPQTTRAFVEHVGAQLGVNGSFFSVAKEKQFNVSGVAASNGDVFSEFEPRFLDGLNISKDNVATIIRAAATSGTAHEPNVKLFNTIGGNMRLVRKGKNVAGKEPAIHPRTAAGVTADGKVLLITVDGRYPLHSIGLTYRELADVLISWGARDAINFDGGGSTTFVMDDPRCNSLSQNRPPRGGQAHFAPKTPQNEPVPDGSGISSKANDPWVLNVPCDPLPTHVHGKERPVGDSLAVFAKPTTGSTENELVYADFEQGDSIPFNLPLSFSGSSCGFDRDRSRAEAMKGKAHDGTWFQRLTIVDDAAADGGGDNPGGAWFVRHVASIRTPGTSVLRPAQGSIGFWARTSSPNLRITMAINDGQHASGKCGVAQNVAADGEWHPYFWRIDDDSAWIHGEGAIAKTFTLDSIEILGPPVAESNQDVTIDIDRVTHVMLGGTSENFDSAVQFRAAVLPPEILVALPGVVIAVPTGWCNR